MNRKVFWRLYGAHLAVALGLVFAKELLDWVAGAKTIDGPIQVLAFDIILTVGISRAVLEAVIAGAMERAPPADWTEPEVRELHRRLLVVSGTVLFVTLVAVVVPVTYAVSRVARTTALVAAIYVVLSGFVTWYARSGGADTIAKLRGE